jgi:hypothetical protein
MSGVTTATAIAIAGVAVAAVGVGVTVMGQSAAADAQKQALDYQAAVSRNNAILAGRASDDALARGQVAEQNAAMAGKQLVGKERASLASNGVDVNSGSALDITTDTAGQNKLDQLTIVSNAQREALGFQAQGGNFDANAALQTASADNASNFGVSAGTALSGLGSVASKWYDFNKQAAPATSDPFDNANMSQFDEAAGGTSGG